MHQTLFLTVRFGSADIPHLLSLVLLASLSQEGLFHNRALTRSSSMECEKLLTRKELLCQGRKVSKGILEPFLL